MGLLVEIIAVVIRILIYCLIARAVLSWFVYAGGQYSGYRQSPVVRIYNVLGAITEPIVRPFRVLLSRFRTGPMDFSPLCAMFALIIIRNIIITVYNHSLLP
ncbi:MAG: YggT family protein [Clostridiales Family XIII bacterium]|jgi:YggT family protein|nr:YggT family protein [Clostridiales Family XIII bacterium]